MIRFYCNSCGKSLRANAAIVGRKTKCTACQEVNRVPTESTRKTGEKKEPDQEILSALSESDSFSPLEDIDMALGDVGSERVVKRSGNLGSFKVKECDAGPQDRVVEVAQKEAAPKPIFKMAQPKRKLAPIVLTAISTLLLAGLGIYFFGGGDDNSRPSATKNEFEQTAHAEYYHLSVAELKKSQRVLDIAGQGFLSATGSPPVEVDRLNELKQQVERLANDPEPMKHGNKLFAAGDSDGARQWLIVETKRVTDLTAEIKKQTELLQSKTYARN